MARAIIKQSYRAVTGSGENLTSFEFGSKVELKNFLAKYTETSGTGAPVALYSVTYTWDDGSKLFFESLTALEAKDL